MVLNEKFQRSIIDMFTRMSTQSPLRDLLTEIEREIPALIRELEEEAVELATDLVHAESVISTRKNDVVTTQILVPLNTQASEVKVTLRDGVLTVVTPLATRVREEAPREQSIPVDRI